MNGLAHPTLEAADMEDIKRATHAINSVASKLKLFTKKQDLQSSSNHALRNEFRHTFVTDKL